MEQRRCSSRTRGFLEGAGWEPGRRHSTEREIEVLESEGYDVPPPVKHFLEEFGGLQVTFPHAQVPEHDDNFVVDPELAVRNTFKAWVEEYQRRTGAASLTPIGHAARNYLLLTMAETGTVYAGYDDVLVVAGESGDEAIENLCSGADLRAVP